MEHRKWYDNAVMVNRDPSWTMAIESSSVQACKKQFEDYFSKYDDTVTDVLLCVFEQTALVPSRSFMWRGQKYLQKIENNQSVSYPQFAPLYKAFAEYGVDGVQIFIDQMHKIGIRPWLTFRMNDAHFTDQPTSPFRPDMYYEEKAEGHLVGDRHGAYSEMFDFRYSRYRSALLGYIKEMLGKYDIFGIELDFMREIYCFDYLGHPEGIQQIMLDYIREIREYTRGIEKRVGHDIKISIRTCRDPEDAYIFGFDIASIVGEGLVDAVVVTPHYNTSDSAMPMRKWRKIIGNSAALIGGIETNNVMGSVNSPENSRAYAAAFYAQGVDGIYFNNHEYYTERNRTAWKINRDTCFSGRRDFVVTYQDRAAYKADSYKPLPHRFVGTTAFLLEIGKVKPTDRVTLLLDFEGVKFTYAQIGDVRCTDAREVEPLMAPKGRDATVNLTAHTPLELNLTGISSEGTVVLELKGNGTVHFIRLSVESDGQ